MPPSTEARLERIVRDLATRELTGPREGYDTTPTDLAFMRRAMGTQLRLLGMRLESRADIDRVAGRLLAMGL